MCESWEALGNRILEAVWVSGRLDFHLDRKGVWKMNNGISGGISSVLLFVKDSNAGKYAKFQYGS